MFPSLWGTKSTCLSLCGSSTPALMGDPGQKRETPGSGDHSAAVGFLPSSLSTPQGQQDSED